MLQHSLATNVIPASRRPKYHPATDLVFHHLRVETLGAQLLLLPHFQLASGEQHPASPSTAAPSEPTTFYSPVCMPTKASRQVLSSQTCLASGRVGAVVTATAGMIEPSGQIIWSFCPRIWWQSNLNYSPWAYKTCLQAPSTRLGRSGLPSTSAPEHRRYAYTE